MSDSTTPQDDKAMPPASAGSVGEVLAKGIADYIDKIMGGIQVWISVKDCLPPFDEYVLVFVPFVGHFEARRNSFGEMWFQHRQDSGLPPDWSWETCDGKDLSNVMPTHWMPLPAPPTDGK